MSFIRNGWGLKYIKGQSHDYIFESAAEEGRPNYIEDYGGIHDSGLAEILVGLIHATYGDDDLFTKYLSEKVATRLGVELREKPIDIDEAGEVLSMKKCGYCLSKTKWVNKRVEKWNYQGMKGKTINVDVKCPKCGIICKDWSAL